MPNYKISRPHRDILRYQDDRSILDYEVEPLVDGIVFYCESPKSASGLPADTNAVVQIITTWLRERYDNVILDDSPLPPGAAKF